MQPATTCSNALQVIDADALPQLGTALQSRHAAVQEASAWAAMHMAVHGAGIADQLAHAGVLPLLLQIVTTAPDESERCTLASSAMVEIVTKCTDIIPLLAMVDQHVPGNILFAALHTAQKILGDSVGCTSHVCDFRCLDGTAGSTCGRKGQRCSGGSQRSIPRWRSEVLPARLQSRPHPATQRW